MGFFAYVSRRMRINTMRQSIDRLSNLLTANKMDHTRGESVKANTEEPEFDSRRVHNLGS